MNFDTRLFASCRCPRGSVQELIGKRDQGEANNGPDPSDGRQLLINKYMADVRVFHRIDQVMYAAGRALFQIC